MGWDDLKLSISHSKQMTLADVERGRGTANFLDVGHTNNSSWASKKSLSVQTMANQMVTLQSGLRLFCPTIDAGNCFLCLQLWE